MKYDLNAFGPAIRQSAAIANALSVKSYRSKQFIVQEGTLSDQVYFILKGSVKVTSFSNSGKEIWHNALGAGKTFGEMGIISEAERCASVITTKTSVIGAMQGKAFTKALQTDPALSFHFLQEMVSRLQTITQQMNEIVAHDIGSRVCAELLRQSSPAPFNTEHSLVNPELTVTKLAQRLNSKRETISRALSALTRSGLVHKEGKYIYLTDLPRLEQRAATE